MSTATSIVILVAYVTLALELVFLHVPSIASSRRLLSASAETIGSFSEPFRRYLRVSRPLALLLFVAPLLLVYALFAYPLLVIWSGADRFDDFLYRPATATQAAGIILIVLGRITTVSSVLAMRRGRPADEPSFYLQTSGLYKWSRNPGLVGMYLLITGIWCTMPSMTMLAGIVVYMAYMHFKVRMEEDYLERRFGRSYIKYRSRTGRYLF